MKCRQLFFHVSQLALDAVDVAKSANADENASQGVITDWIELARDLAAIQGQIADDLALFHRDHDVTALPRPAWWTKRGDA